MSPPFPLAEKETAFSRYILAGYQTHRIPSTQIDKDSFITFSWLPLTEFPEAFANSAANLQQLAYPKDDEDNHYDKSNLSEPM